MNLTAVVLAAGLGKRMQSETPKVLHKVLGKPMILHALDAVAQISNQLPVVIVGHGAGQVCEAIEGRARWAVQENQLGTAHAVRQAEPLLRGKTDLVLVTSADLPLLRPETLANLVNVQKDHSGPLTITTVVLEDSHGFGRIVRAANGMVREIVEEAQATPEILAIRELNAGIYCVRADWLWDALERIPLSPKGEYYLTDLVGLAVADGLSVQGVAMQDPDEAIGVNNRVHLAEAERLMRARVNQAWMEQGVTFLDPLNTTVETGVSIGRDSIVWPSTYLIGETHIGEKCTVGPNSLLKNARLGKGCSAPFSILDGVTLPDGTILPPYSTLQGESNLVVENPDRKDGAGNITA
jgi:bifunctional UDP-N-acetylglucosamine pyrophosphorylase/glucosamine-1-phosphate N-acetyltransferase